MTTIKLLCALVVLGSAVASHQDEVINCAPHPDCSTVRCAFQDPACCESGRTILCGCCFVCEVTLPEGGACAPFIPTNEACAPGVPCVGGTCQSNKDKGKCTGK